MSFRVTLRPRSEVETFLHESKAKVPEPFHGTEEAADLRPSLHFVRCVNLFLRQSVEVLL